nr:MAG TPA: hypothetical protein [Caudoviricetes sp.]
MMLVLKIAVTAMLIVINFWMGEITIQKIKQKKDEDIVILVTVAMLTVSVILTIWIGGQTLQSVLEFLDNLLRVK